MPPKLDRYIARFKAADRTTRLETLLDFSRRLPPLPPERERDKEAHRIPECQTPVFLWVEVDNGAVRISADVPRESPTVRGFVSLLVHGLEGATPAEVAALPDDLLHSLGLDETLGMLRMHGLTAVVQRLKRAAAAAA
ncbi:MAG TPA: SufE family protein [Gemmatimonadales bacterium]|nr:SufE family protein [Gemmatimonadales bacterium]